MLKLSALPLSNEQKYIIKYMEVKKLYSLTCGNNIYWRSDFIKDRNLAARIYNERESIIRNYFE